MNGTAGATLPDGRAEASDMPGGSARDEAGSQDNLLELNPNDENFAFAKDWEDGKEYVITNMRVRQVSAGKFTPLSAESGESAENEGEMPDEGETGAMGRASDYDNPAVAGLVAGEKS